MNSNFLHNMGVASLVAGVAFIIMAYVWKNIK